MQQEYYGPIKRSNTAPFIIIQL